MQKQAVMRVVQAIERPVERATRLLLAVLFSVMLGLSALQIALRFLFGTSLPWADQAARNLVLWVGLLGAVLATGADKHFNIDVVTRFIPPEARRWFRVFAELFASVVCGGLVLASWEFLTAGVDGAEEAFRGVPVYAVVLIFPLSFALMALQFLARAIATALADAGEEASGVDGRAS